MPTTAKTDEFRSHRLADRYCGMNRQAALLLLYMADEEIDLPLQAYLQTMPYGNCREQGFVVVIHRPVGLPVNVAFFEHRNSDELCALRWEGRPHIAGVARVDDVPEKDYPDKWTLAWTGKRLDFDGAVEYLREVIRDSCQIA